MSITRMRRSVQAFGIILIIAVPLLNRTGITFVTGTLYSLAIGPLWVTDPVIGVQTILTTKRIDAALLLSLLVPLLLALAFGRVFCGWFCPQNTISELVDRLSATLKIRRKFRPSPLPAVRYAVLVAVLIVTTVKGFPLVSLLSAPGILSVQASRLIYEGAVGLELGLIGLIILAELFLVRRAWCNHICPVGSFLGIFRLRRTLKVAFTEEGGRACGRCYVCIDACSLGLNPVEGRIYPQCHNCGDCIAACGQATGGKNPLAFRF